MDDCIKKKVGFSSPRIRVAQTEKLGLGVFSSIDIYQGQVVEIAPVILIEGPLERIPNVLKTRVYYWVDSKFFAVALGYGSLYNHCDAPNLSYEFDAFNKTISYLALRSIKQGDELTINYNSENGDNIFNDECWFSVFDIEKL